MWSGQNGSGGGTGLKGGQDWMSFALMDLELLCWVRRPVTELLQI